MEQKKSNTITSLLRKSVGLPAKGSSCCGGVEETAIASTESSEARKSIDAGACCGSKPTTTA